MNGTIEQLRETVRRGATWIEAKVSAEGGFRGCEGDLAAYYKSLLAFILTGRIETGARTLAYLRRNLCTSGFELGSGEHKTCLTRIQHNLANYMDGWVAIGAWLLSDYEFAEGICRRLGADQSTLHGGILTGPEKWVGRARFDLSTAASCGRAFLVAGRREAAYAAADFLVAALDHQSDPKTGLDLSYDSEWRAMTAPDPTELSYYRFDLLKRGEKVWFPAFSAAFLSEAFQLSGDRRYLGAAEAYFRYVARCPEFRDGTLANGKSGWASGLLALSTGTPEYAAAFGMIVPNVISRQRENGEFVESASAAVTRGRQPATPIKIATEPETASSLARSLERTAEFTSWTAEYLRLIGMGVAPPDQGGAGG